MLDLATGRRVILRELDGLTIRLDEASMSDWRRPVRCEGWSVMDLALHCTSAPRAAAEAFRRMSAGVSEAAPPPITPGAEREDVIGTLRFGRIELAEALNAMTPQTLESVMPMFFGSMPGIFGFQLVALELGMHRNDLEWALGNEEGLPAEITDAAAALAPILLPMLGAGADQRPDGPLGYRLESPSQEFEFVFTDGEWKAGSDPSVPMCLVVGDESSITLFSYGRIGSDHPSLTVAGDLEVARMFKTYLPGPVMAAADRTVAVET